MVDGYSSPRLLVETALSVGEDHIMNDPLLWTCLTCERCSEICPSLVEFSEFVQESRQLARAKDQTGDCTHSGMIQTWGRMMTEPDLVQHRLLWLDEGLSTNQDSDTIYFPGCLPYYQEAFGGMQFEGNDIARAAIKILNQLGIEPALLENERCCGHDQFWQGDMETFSQLAKLNLELLKESGAERIITTCPECFYTLKYSYPEHVGEHDLQVLHLVELLEQSQLSFSNSSVAKQNNRTVTYQDPCRLGRFESIYQQPRDLIHEAGYKLVEMEHNRNSGICCGTSCWSNCGSLNHEIQENRLSEARSTKADVLITACHKCQIHLLCAQKGMSDDKDRVIIRDLTTMIADQI
jgi:Fe-S oxidoreductase